MAAVVSHWYRSGVGTGSRRLARTLRIRSLLTTMQTALKSRPAGSRARRSIPRAGSAETNIDDGRELFGDSTPLKMHRSLSAALGARKDGFEALDKEDTIRDGLVSSADARWTRATNLAASSTRTGQPMGELLSLSSLGIAPIRRNQALQFSGQWQHRSEPRYCYAALTGSQRETGTVGEVSNLTFVEHSTFSTSVH